MHGEPLESAFLGASGSVVLAGSDCGRLFAWDTDTAAVIGTVKADEDIVNVVQPHPCEPMVATAGISSLVRIWGPGGNSSYRGEEDGARISATRVDEITADNSGAQGSNATLFSNLAQLTAMFG